MTTDGIALSITITSMNGNYSVSKICSPAALALWAFAGMVVLHLNALIHASFVKPVNPKPAVHVDSKAPNNGSPNSAIFYRTANGNISPSLCPTGFGLSSTITGPCSTDSFAAPPEPCSNTQSALDSKLAFFVPCILINQHPHIHLSVTRGGLTQYHAWNPIFFQKERRLKSLAQRRHSTPSRKLFSTPARHITGLWTHSRLPNMVSLPQRSVSTLLESAFCQKDTRRLAQRPIP